MTVALLLKMHAKLNRDMCELSYIMMLTSRLKPVGYLPHESQCNFLTNVICKKISDWRER